MPVCAKEPFTYDGPDGAQLVIHRGRPIPDGHPAIKGREHLFEPADELAVRASGAAVAVETATAAPGERRSVSRAKGSGSSRFAEEV